MAGETIMIEPEQDEEEGFTTQQLKIAKRFVELVGGAEKARALVDKVDECNECLDLIDDPSEASDASAIQKLAGAMPGLPDLPMELSGLYNPSAGGQQM
jgi:hypothetical protein